MKTTIKTNSLNQLNPTPHIPRTPTEGVYRSDYRWRTAEHYLVQVAKASDPSEALAHIWTTEPDEIVLTLLLFECGGACPFKSEIAYAVDCHRDNAHTHRASKIKAFVVANLDPEEIARELRTSLMNIQMFEWIFFNFRDYLNDRFLLDEICSQRDTTPEAALEARWLQVARDRGYSGLCQVMLGRYSVDSSYKRWPTDFSEIAQIGLERVNDYVRALQISGEPPSEEDLQWFSRLPQLGEFAEKVGFTRPPKTEPKLSKVLSYKEHLSKADDNVRALLLIGELLADPSPDNIERFRKRPLFSKTAPEHSTDPESAPGELLLEILAEAIQIEPAQIEKLQYRLTRRLYAALVSAAQSEDEAEKSASPTVAASRENSRISWRQVLAAVDKLSTDPNHSAVRRKLEASCEETPQPSESH